MGTLMQLLQYGGLYDYYFNQLSESELYMNACYYGNTDGILKGINNFHVSNNNYEAFKSVCRNKNFNGIKIFVDNNKTNKDILKIGLEESCKYGVLENVKYIWELLSDENLNDLILTALHHVSNGLDGWSHHYISINTYDVYKYLISFENVVIDKKTYNNIFIHTKNVEIKKDILEKYPDFVNLLDYEQLKFACEKNLIHVVKFIFENNKNIDIFQNDHELFINACNNNSLCCAEYLSKLCKKHNLGYVYSIDVCQNVDSFGCMEFINYKISDNYGNVICKYIHPECSDYDVNFDDDN